MVPDNIHRSDAIQYRALVSNHQGDAQFHEHCDVDQHVMGGAHDHHYRSSSDPCDGFAQALCSGTLRALLQRSVLRHISEERDLLSPNNLAQSVHQDGAHDHGSTNACGPDQGDADARMESIHT